MTSQDADEEASTLTQPFLPANDQSSSPSRPSVTPIIRFVNDGGSNDPTRNSEDDPALALLYHGEGSRESLSPSSSTSYIGESPPLGEADGQLTLLVSAINLAKLIIGAGATALPFAFSKLGIVLSISFLSTVAFMTHFSLDALTLGALASGTSTYSGSLTGLAGRWATIGLEASLVLRCAGLMVVYVVIGTDVLAGRSTSLPGVVCEVVEMLGGHPEHQSWCSNREGLGLLLCLVGVAPLLASDHLAGTTSKAAFVGLLGASVWAGSTVLLAIVANFKGGAASLPWLPPSGIASLATDATQLLSTLPVIATAYTCQMSVHYSMRELKNFTQGRMSIVSALAVTFCTIIFLSVGLGSISAFAVRTGEVPADILEAFTYDNVSVWIPGMAARVLAFVVRLSFLFSILANFPLQNLPYRDSFARLLLRRRSRLSPKGMTYWLVTYGSLITFYFIAMSAKSIWGPLQIVGATAGAYIAFFAPAIIALMSLKRRGLLSTSTAAAAAQERPHYWRINAWSLIVLGAVQVVTGIGVVLLK